eukprot:TRINITY_DN7699_c0_g1_i5.p1 TRINITY_DN7699_c0_g1~~TRINITY_DN7699_c0_g1_i5.p1  ORF type:complete len:246 (-),score=52.70 TRINITY_DN7699_c0_g1_i5:79-816(-)
MHRESKRAQSDSVELFRSLYFCANQVIEEGIVFNLSQDGFFVYVPKFGLKKKVFFKSQDGISRIPDPRLPGKVFEESEFVTPTSITYKDVDDIPVIEIEISKKLRTLKLFDHVLLRIGSKASKLHSPETTVQLAGFTKTSESLASKPALSSKCNPGPMTKEMVNAVITRNESAKEKKIAHNDTRTVDRSTFYEILQEALQEEQSEPIMLMQGFKTNLEELPSQMASMKIISGKRTLVGRRSFAAK